MLKMQCKHHTERLAETFCAGCGSGLCGDCSQAIVLGEYYCYDCALFVSDAPPSRRWGPMIYASLVWWEGIVIIAGIILFT
jgi:hypothetical protein